jgi:hypothetical protein
MGELSWPSCPPCWASQIPLERLVEGRPSEIDLAAASSEGSDRDGGGQNDTMGAADESRKRAATDDVSQQRWTRHCPTAGPGAAKFSTLILAVFKYKIPGMQLGTSYSLTPEALRICTSSPARPTAGQSSRGRRCHFDRK